MKYFLSSLLLFFTWHVGWSQTTTDKLTITHLTGNLYVYTSYGLFKGERIPANGMYLITKQGAVLFDAPWDTTQFKPLMDSIAKRHHKRITMHIATHWHDDRSAGLTFYGQQGAKTYTSQLTDRLCQEQHKPRAQYTFNRDTVFHVGEYIFETYYPGEGHTKDNIVIWFQNDRVLYGGCFIKSREATNLGNVSDGNAEAWPQSIRNVQKKFGQAAHVIPGHDDWKGKQSLNHTLLLLKQEGFE